MRRRIAGSSHTRVRAMSTTASAYVAPVQTVSIPPDVQSHSVASRPTLSPLQRGHKVRAIRTRLSIAISDFEGDGWKGVVSS